MEDILTTIADFYQEHYVDQKMEDLAVVYQILMDKRDYEQASITVTDNLLEAFWVSLEDIHEQAIRNMDILQPYSFRGISETVIDMMAQNIACEGGISIEDARDMAASMMPETKEMIPSYLESKGAWVTEIGNQDSREYGEYHLDVRYNTDTEKLFNMKERKVIELESSDVSKEVQLLREDTDKYGIYQLKDNPELDKFR